MTAAVAPVRILYVAGLGKSGSTILSMILGQIPGFVAVGELRSFWRRDLVHGGVCSCMRPYAECPFWSQVSTDAFPDGLPEDGARLEKVSWRALRPRSLASYMLPGGWQRIRRGLGDYPARVHALYRAIADRPGTRVIVDESKTPVYASLLADLPSVELVVLHLVRDPRAAAFSWSHERHAFRSPEEPPFQPVRVSKSVLLWQVTNLLIERRFGRRASRYARLRYEDFVRAPHDSLRSVLALLGEEGAPLPFVSDAEAVIGETHLLSGSEATRRLMGSVAIRPDDQWRVDMSKRDKLVTTALSLPLLVRYGYSLRS